MTVVTVADFLQAASHPAHDVRRMVMSMFAGRGGVVPRTATFTDLKVSQRGAGANMSVDVAEGSCLVTGTESTYQGLYHCENQGVQNVIITAANVTNARRDMNMGSRSPTRSRSRRSPAPRPGRLLIRRSQTTASS